MWLKKYESFNLENYFNVTNQKKDLGAEIIYDHVTYVVTAVLFPLICKLPLSEIMACMNYIQLR